MVKKKNADIRALIESKGIRHKDLAEILCISPFTLSRWLRNELTDKQRKRIMFVIEHI